MTEQKPPQVRERQVDVSELHLTQDSFKTHRSWEWIKYGLGGTIIFV